MAFLGLIDVTVAWAVLLAVIVLAYVLLDGFDLGMGILFLIERRCEERDTMVNSIAPVWDGNETWLVMGGGGLFAVFPLAYSVILPALYPVLIGMLLALILRGVAFEFRFRATSWGRFWWDIAFCGGSIVAALCQGLALGGLLQGIRVVDHGYAGGWWDWMTPFTLLCGVSVVVGYALLGACWLVWRTEGDLQSINRRAAGALGAATLALIAAVSIWTPFLNERFALRWFHWPGILFTSPVPILVGFVAWLFARGLRRHHQITPLICAELWFVLCYAGLGISLWPLIVPPGHHHLAGRSTARKPDLLAGRGRRDASDDYGLHRIRVLAVPRKGEGRSTVSLIDATASQSPALLPSSNAVASPTNRAVRPTS